MGRAWDVFMYPESERAERGCGEDEARRNRELEPGEALLALRALQYLMNTNKLLLLRLLLPESLLRTEEGLYFLVIS